MTTDPRPWTGLLSPALGALRADAEAMLPEHVRLAQDVNTLALYMIVNREQEMRRPTDYLAPPMLGRTIADYESSILLAGNGFRQQARAMVRSTFESACFCAAACGDHPDLIGAIENGHEKYRLQVADALSSLPQTPPEIAARLRELATTLPPLDRKAQQVSVEQLAKDVGDGLYAILYRSLSQDAHPTATSLLRHCNVDAEGTITGFTIGPDFDDYADTLLRAVASMLIAMTAYAERFCTADVAAVQAQRTAYHAVSEAAAT